MCDVGVILLAGGESRRMGFPKWALPWKGTSLLAHHIEAAYLAGFQDIWVSANDQRIERYIREQQVAVPFISDEVPGRGPLGGLTRVLQKGRSDWYMAVAVDMPRWNYAVMKEWLPIYVKDDVEAVVPVVNGQPHPLGALYKKSLWPSMKEALAEGLYSLQRYLETRKTAYVGMHDPGRWMENCNTMDDVMRLRGTATHVGAHKLVISVNADRSKQGKTTVVQQLLTGLVQRGLTFGYVKSSHHNAPSFRRKGDTDRALVAGAKVAAMVGTTRYALYDNKDILEVGMTESLGFTQEEKLYAMMDRILSMDGIDGVVMESRTYRSGRSIYVSPPKMKGSLEVASYDIPGWLPFGVCEVTKEPWLYTMAVVDASDDLVTILDQCVAYYVGLRGGRS